MALGGLCGRFTRFLLAHRLAFDGEPVGVADDAVEDRNGERRILGIGMPLLDRELIGDQRRLAVVAVVEDLERIAADRSAS